MIARPISLTPCWALSLCPFLWLCVAPGRAVAETPTPPRTLDARLKIELVAAEPDLVTPTGIAVDRHGNVVVVESHTHFRPPDYSGPTTDRLRRFSGRRADGYAAHIDDVYVGGAATMNLAFHPDGSLWVAQRSEVYRLPPRVLPNAASPQVNAGPPAAQPETLVRLVTDGDYPHNGLSGFAFDGAGRAYFGLGENLGAAYRLVGADGSEFSGGGEGGSVFSCDSDGGDLRRTATGFWNPFHLCFDWLGNLFAVDNDPDSRPPCRLLHVVHRGDYGYRFRNGRKGLHPFTAWNGELPGTLPMVAGTGEAPSGIVWCDHPAWPAEFRGTLLVTSWGDHAIERYRPQPHGASCRAEREVVIAGDEDFRPVGIALAPDGALYISDWVDKSYAVHGKGRVWRVSCAKSRDDEDTESGENQLFRSIAESVDTTGPAESDELWRQAAAADPFLAHYARQRLLTRADADPRSRFLVPEARLPALLLLREQHPDGIGEAIERIIGAALDDADPKVRFVAVQWIGEARLTAFRPRVEQALAAAGNSRGLFAAQLAALELLDGRKPQVFDQHGRDVYLAQLALSDRADAVLRQRLLRMIAPTCPALTAAALVEWHKAGPDPLRLEVLRTLSRRDEPECRAVLRQVAVDEAADDEQRLAAVACLVHERPDERELLVGLASHGATEFRHEALRSLQEAELSDADVQRIAAAASDEPSQEMLRRVHRQDRLRPLPLDPDALEHAALELLKQPGDAAAGERIFFHPRGPGCYKCHEVDGRGAAVGPELTTIGSALNGARLVQSIIAPSREMAPQYTAWSVALTDGRTLTGVLVGETVEGQQYVDAQGRVWSVRPQEVAARQPSRESIMPANLVHPLTATELRDLLTFLSEQK